ncbi:DUF4193 family protein [Georgenia subflava]|uniref:DUF4193 family protein n=1 Tax=Georgenia subflava TaxID=1622177 RepID=A0A6N7EL77_9MICO|nr:DUF4193 family protein [Georgenia subflava]
MPGERLRESKRQLGIAQRSKPARKPFGSREEKGRVNRRCSVHVGAANVSDQVAIGEELTVRVLPRQVDEISCSRGGFLVHHQSQLAYEEEHGHALGGKAWAARLPSRREAPRTA